MIRRASLAEVLEYAEPRARYLRPVAGFARRAGERMNRRGIGDKVGSGDPAWTPAVASPALWLEGDMGVTVTAGPLVTAWKDQSANALTATASGALSPTTSTAINGKPCISFSGATALQVPTLTLSGLRTFCVVYKSATLPASVAAHVVCLKDTGSSAFDDYFLSTLGGTYKSIGYLAAATSSAVAAVGINPVLNTTAHSILITYNAGPHSSTASYTVTYDGVSQTVLASGVVGRTATDLGSIGGTLTSASGLGGAFTGDIGGVWMFPALSAPNLAAFNSYRLGKYGV